MKKVKMILFAVLPMTLSITALSMSGVFIMNNQVYAGRISIVLTSILFLIVILQYFLKDNLYFPVTFFIAASIFAVLVNAIPQSGYNMVIRGNSLTRTILVNPQIILYSMLFLMASIPQLTGMKPFTVYFAKLSVPETFQVTELFKTVNKYISTFWALLFALCLAAQFIPDHTLRTYVPVAIQILIGFPGTKFLQPYLIQKLSGTIREDKRNYIKTARDAVTGMPYMFDKKASEDVDAVFQFIISGNNVFEGYLEVKNRNCLFHEGIHESPAITIKSPEEIWLAIARDEISGQDAFLKGLYKLEGNLSLIPLLNKLFKHEKKVPVKNSKKTVNETKHSAPELFSARYCTTRPGSIRKVLAINGSPRKPGTSKTDILTQAFLGGCRDAGAETETVYLTEKNISHCTGCYTCWTKTPGVCIFKDDVPEIMDAANKADLLVYASPLYHFGIISILKKYIERTLPGLKPHMVENHDGKTSHPLREGYREDSYTVIIGVCGFPEVNHFGAFSANFHYMAQSGEDHGLKIMAEIYRPFSEILGNPFYKTENDRVLSAAVKAGKQAVKEGYISADLMKDIAKVNLDIDAERATANKAWDICIKKEITLPMLQESIKKGNR